MASLMDGTQRDTRVVGPRFGPLTSIYLVDVIGLFEPAQPESWRTWSQAASTQMRLDYAL